jgi:hypothetical protein
MEFALQPKREAWRGRGKPRLDVPPQVQAMADRTYRTGEIGRVTYGPDDEGEARELMRLLNSYANSLGRRMRFQHDEGELRFEMADRNARKKVTA